MSKTALEPGLKATFVGMIINTILAGGKMWAGVFGHSNALVADATESLGDLLSSVIVWRGLVVASTPADENHPYGHGKAEPLAATFVALLLFLAALWVGVHAILGAMTPHPVPAPFTLVVLLSVVALKEGLFRYALAQAEEADSQAVRSDAWHHRSDAITSLMAGVGIATALLAGPAYYWADDAAAGAAALIIAWSGWRVLRPALDELMDAAPDVGLVEAIRAAAASIPGLDQVEKCIVRKIGYEYWVDMHVEVDPAMTVEKAHDIAHQVKNKVRSTVPSVRDVLVHVEPRPERSSAGTAEPGRAHSLDAPAL